MAAAASGAALKSTVESAGRLASGEEVTRVRLSNGAMTVDVLSHGASIESVRVPSAGGGPAEEVTLQRRGGTLDDLVGAMDEYFLGVTPGRVANRIAGASFELDGATFTLDANNGGNCLHGGDRGLSKLPWRVVGEPSDGKAVFAYDSPDGDGGFPGDLSVTLTYSLTASNELVMEHRASVAGRACPVNLCNHTYWNLSGDFKAGAADHSLWLGCGHVVETDPASLIPTGRILPAEGHFDFSDPAGTPLGPRLEALAGTPQMGFDHCFARGGLPASPDPDAAAALASMGTMGVIARAHHAASGRTMEVSTTQPGVQLYTANFMPKDAPAGDPIRYHNAFCLETQNYPDAVNQPGFPPSVVRPGAESVHRTVHAFSW